MTENCETSDAIEKYPRDSPKIQPTEHSKEEVQFYILKIHCQKYFILINFFLLIIGFSFKLLAQQTKTFLSKFRNKMARTSLIFGIFSLVGANILDRKNSIKHVHMYVMVQFFEGSLLLYIDKSLLKNRHGSIKH